MAIFTANYGRGIHSGKGKVVLNVARAGVLVDYFHCC